MSYWGEIRTQADADRLMNLVGGFHDSIITQIRYEGDGYCDHRQWMSFTDSRRLVMRFDSQCTPKETPSIELVFDGLEEMNLLPAPADCTGEILGASLRAAEDMVHFELSSGTEICAAKLHWLLMPKISFRLLWENPDQVTDVIIESISAMISKDPSLIACVLSPWNLCDKSRWESFARVIANQSDAVLEHYAAGVLNWLQDLNWPGSMLLFDRLKTVRPGKIDRAIAECIEFAEEVCNDEEWAEFLRQLQQTRIKI